MDLERATFIPRLVEDLSRWKQLGNIGGKIYTMVAYVLIKIVRSSAEQERKMGNLNCLVRV